jgi:hypothetical protein
VRLTLAAADELGNFVTAECVARISVELAHTGFKEEVRNMTFMDRSLTEVGVLLPGLSAVE